MVILLSAAPNLGLPPGRYSTAGVDSFAVTVRSISAADLSISDWRVLVL